MSTKRVPSLPYKQRVCSSADQGNTEHCEPNIFDFPEVRLYVGNWESSIFTTWIAQIYLSEILRVPVTIETGSPDIHTDFYHAENPFGYSPVAYNWNSLKYATSMVDGVCPPSTVGALDYRPCAHAMLEVWPSGQISNINQLIQEDYGEIAGSIGGYGTISWYTFEHVIAKDPTLKSYYGFTDRVKLGRATSTIVLDRPLFPATSNTKYPTQPHD